MNETNNTSEPESDFFLAFYFLFSLLVPMRASPVPSVVRGSLFVKFSFQP